MGKKSRDKGYRGEHNLVKILSKAGLNAKRVPLSGATSFAGGDIRIYDYELRGEVKLRKNGEGFKKLYKWLKEEKKEKKIKEGMFKQIQKWIKDNDCLFLKADRQPYLVVMPIDVFITLLDHSDKSDREEDKI